MTYFSIRGTCKNVSTEELRCMLQASATVLELHGKQLSNMRRHDGKIIVKLVDKKRLGKTRISKRQCTGRAYRRSQRILLGEWLGFSDLFTVVVHEMMHLYIEFPEDNSENLTCKLTAKLKPSIARVYNGLIEGYYRRAAFFAHTKISYPKEGPDSYDDIQWTSVELSETGKKYRKVKE